MKFKLTKKSYKRKLVSFGLILFSGVSLISTGFAAWIISQGSDLDGDGNIKVGIVEDKSLNITDLVFIADSSRTKTEDGNLSAPQEYKYEDIKNGTYNLSYNFDAVFNDTIGSIKYDTKGDAPFESMNIQIKGDVNNASNLLKLTSSIELPIGIKTCVEKGYLILPDGAYYKGEKEILQEIITTPHATDKNKVSFNYNLGFKWGSAFQGLNPSYYFDNQGEIITEPDELTIPKNISPTEMMTLLNEMRGLILGLQETGTKEFEGRTYKTYNPEELKDPIRSEKFKITISAISN